MYMSAISSHFWYHKQLPGAQFAQALIKKKRAVTQKVLMTNYTANLNCNEPIYLYMYLVALVDFKSGV